MCSMVKLFVGTTHVNFDAAIRYVMEIRNNKLDPVIKRNAERSIPL